MRSPSQGPDWWQASDGRWYAPELHPHYASAQLPADPPAHMTETHIPGESAWNPSMPPGWWQDQNGAWHLPEVARSGAPRHAVPEPDMGSSPELANPSMPPGWWQDQNGAWHLPEVARSGAPRHAVPEPDLASTAAATDDPPAQESELRSTPESSARRRRRAVLLGFPACLIALIALVIFLATIGNGTSNHLSADRVSLHRTAPPTTAPPTTAPPTTAPPTTAPPTTAPPTTVADTAGNSGNSGNSGAGSTLDPNALVSFTQCANDPTNPATSAGAGGTDIAISGTVTNTGSTANDYDITIAILGDPSAQGTADVQVNSVGPGQTQSFTTTGSVTNSPTQALTCQAIEVMSEPV